MHTQILKGRPVYKKLLKDLKRMRTTIQLQPRLDILLIGDNPASIKFTQIKQKVAKKLNINVKIHHLPSNITSEKASSLIETLNKDPAVHGIIIQLPLPKQIDMSILNLIDPTKDVDGLTAINLGLIYQGIPYLPTGAPVAIFKLLHYYKISFDNQNIALIGMGHIVGTPLLGLIQTLTKPNSVKILTKYTKNLKQQLEDRTLIISATGTPKLLTSQNTPKDSIVIDLGTSLDKNTQQIVGDTDFTDLLGHVKAITPVPGGVGPITVLCLFENLMTKQLLTF